MPALLGTRRRSPPRVPLAWQLSLAFLLVSSLALGAVSLFSAALTRSEFRTLLSEQERERIEASLQSHLQAGGTLDTFRPSAARAEPGGPPRSFFVVTDNNFQPRGSHGGPPLTPREREQAVPVRVDGQQVGYLVPRGRPGIEGAGAAFLRRTNQALAQAALVSALLAALLGTWLSRRLLQPLDGLRGGIAALARGEQPRPVQDELGDLLQSFETMHAQVLEAQQMNRQLTADIAALDTLPAKSRQFIQLYLKDQRHTGGTLPLLEHRLLRGPQLFEGDVVGRPRLARTGPVDDRGIDDRLLGGARVPLRLEGGTVRPGVEVEDLLVVHPEARGVGDEPSAEVVGAHPVQGREDLGLAEKVRQTPCVQEETTQDEGVGVAQVIARDDSRAVVGHVLGTAPGLPQPRRDPGRDNTRDESHDTVAFTLVERNVGHGHLLARAQL